MTEARHSFLARSRRRGTAALAAAALAASMASSALAPSTASAAAGVPITSAPDLVSAQIVASNYGIDQSVQFCFDQPIDTITTNLFWVRTYDADRYLRARPAPITKKSQNPNCVLAVFDYNAIDLNSQGSIGEVDARAITALNGMSNYATSVPINSGLAAQSGRTSAPDLISADINQNQPNLVDFTFDSPIATTAPSASLFHAIAADGTNISTSQTISGAVSPFPGRVRIDFGKAVTEAVAFTTDASAVQPPASGDWGGSAAKASPPGVIARSTPAAPILKSATPDSNGQFRLTFSARLSSGFNPTRVVAILDDGTSVPATGSPQFPDDNKQVLVSFAVNSGVVEEPSSVVRMIATTGAAQDFVTGAPAPISAVDVSVAPMQPGRTNAPDLVNVQLRTGDNQAVFQYDEKVYSVPAPGDLQLLTSAGTLINNVSVSTSGLPSTEVVVNFGDNFSSGIGASVGDFAVRDIRMHSSPNAAVLPHTDTTGCTSNCTAPPGPGGGTPGAGTSATCAAAQAAAGTAATAVTKAQAKVTKAQSKVKKAKSKKAKTKAKKALKKAKAALTKAQGTSAVASAVAAVTCK